MEEARRAKWNAEIQRIRLGRYAARLCRALRKEKFEKARRLIKEGETRAFTAEYELGICPLSVAAETNPKLALQMLDRGANPKEAPLSDGTLLHAIIEEGDLEAASTLLLFRRLLEKGVDPEELIVWNTRLSPSPYAASLLAVVLSIGMGAEPYLRALVDHPGLEGKILSRTPEHPHLTASEFAWHTGDDWALEIVEGWDRWSRNRRAWVGAVLRAPRR